MKTMNWIKRELAEIYEPTAATSVQQPVSKFIGQIAYPLLVAAPLAVAIYGWINPGQSATPTHLTWVAACAATLLGALLGRSFLRRFVHS